MTMRPRLKGIMMRNLLKYAGIALLVTGLAACDNNGDKKQTADHSAHASQADQTVTLLGGKLTFTLPPGMADKSDKLSTQDSNRHVWADNSGQRAIIAFEGTDSDETLEAMASRLEEQQRSRDPQLQVVTSKAITVDGQTLHQLDTVISSNNQSAWSSIVLGKIDGKLLTLQISLPAENQQQSQTEAESIINSIKLK